MSLFRHSWRLVALCALALAAVTTIQAAAQAAPRVVAIADVHGDLPAFRAVLRDAGVLDANDAWIGGDTIVVQLGDLLDRGPAMKSALDFARSLETRAAAAGGRFVPLLGNHEVMNLVGDLRYVVPENFAEFADAGSEARREKAWREFEKWQKRRATARGEEPPPAGKAEETAWLAAHPTGLLEHRDAFGPAGAYGRWLRSRRVLVVEQNTLFAHGGVAPSRIGSTADEIDRQAHAEIALFDELRQEFVAEGLVLSFFDLPELTLALRAELGALDAAEARAQADAAAAGKEHTMPAKISSRRTRFERFLDWSNWSIFASDGPTWFRDYSQWSDEEAAAALPKLQAAFGVERFVGGHTPQADGTIRSRIDGAVYLIDTGMNSAYVKGGRGSALEIAAGTVTAIYPGGERVLLRQGPVATLAPAAAPTPVTPAAPAAPSALVAPAPAASAPPVAALRFLGPDGQPLPFASDEELLAFLREAPVVEVKDIGEGITHPRRLTLEREGVRARAVFRDVAVEKRVANVGQGRRELNFRDYYGFEPAAYRLARLLGLDRVPPADLRRYGRSDGSVQVWIEKASTEGVRREEGKTPPNTLRWKRQMQTMQIWDALVGNTDRNQGNILIGPDWEIWFIDHTRSFRQSTDLPNADKIVWCPRSFFEALRTVSDEQIRQSVRGLLTSGETNGVLERRKKVVALLEGLIRTKGESAVLFDASL